MKKTTFAVMGLGNRGRCYVTNLLEFPEKMEITAIADPRESCRETYNAMLHLPEDRVFHSGEELLAQPKLADVMVICTQDRQHKDHAIAAMERGYDLLLEKPISNKLEDVRQIAEAANRLGRKVLVCHVLRYTPFYRTVKRLLDQGAVGRILNVEAAEHVSCWHMAHAYVRGQWRRKDESSPIILAKCCHDMDIILWLTGKKPLSVTSIGSLDYFCKENMPQGAPLRCTDGCPAEATCPYHSVNFYLPRIPAWPTNNMLPNPNEENIRQLLDTTRYGICVFQQDNDVVDHQQVQIQLSDSVTASFSLNALHTRSTRTIRIGGTKGELWGDMKDQKVYWQPHGGEAECIEIGGDMAGHGGGDKGLVADAIDYFSGKTDIPGITTLDDSAASHYLAFAAEESRLLEGQKIQLA